MPERSTASHHSPSFEQILADYLQAVEAGENPNRQALLQRFPHFAEELQAFFENFDGLNALTPATLAPAQDAPVYSMPAPPPDFDDYEVRELIGSSGMGVVYKAWQNSAKRFVALKMILPRPDVGESDLLRFRRESEAAAQLRHSNIVPIHDVGVVAGPDGQSRPYFTMDLIEGGSLAQYLKDREGIREKPALWAAEERRLALVLAQVAGAVHFAHQHRILHRDLKPGNVMLDRAGRPYLIDFGLTKRLDEEGSPTRTCEIIGTAGYLAPEQAIDPKGVTTATDVYGLGATFYECLTGRPPFQGEKPLDTIHLMLNTDPVPPRRLHPHVDRDLETICLKCLNKEPRQRYGSAEAVAEELHRWLEGRPIKARPVGNPERVWRWCRRNPGMAGVSALALLLLVTVAVLASLSAAWLMDERDLIEQTERQRRVQLVRALRDQARAGRMSRQPGQRFRSLEAIKTAVGLARELDLPEERFAELRTEAIAY